MISSNSQTVDLCAERPERELGHFERLDAERNADDGDAVEHACTQIAERHPAADHRMLAKAEPTPPPYCTVLPNGVRVSPAILNA